MVGDVVVVVVLGEKSSGGEFLRKNFATAKRFFNLMIIQKVVGAAETLGLSHFYSSVCMDWAMNCGDRSWFF